jgi:hypothetical protein
MDREANLATYLRKSDRSQPFSLCASSEHIYSCNTLRLSQIRLTTNGPSHVRGGSLRLSAALPPVSAELVQRQRQRLSRRKPLMIRSYKKQKTWTTTRNMCVYYVYIYIYVYTYMCIYNMSMCVCLVSITLIYLNIYFHIYSL